MSQDKDLQQGEGQSADAERKRIEQDRLSRRSALRRLGIGAGTAAFSLFAVEDLARQVLSRMQEGRAHNQIGETVARQFRNAGVAFAEVGAVPITSATPTPITPECKACLDAATSGFNNCVAAYNACIAGGGTEAVCGPAKDNCNHGVNNTAMDCFRANHCFGF